MCACTENPKVNQVQKDVEKEKEIIGENNNIAAQTFTFRELATATKNFRQECLIGEGGFGRVYKGKLDKTNQVGTLCNPTTSSFGNHLVF